MAMGMKKKIVIGVAAIFAIIIVLGVIGSNSSNSTTQNTGTLITESVDQMLPTRAEIPTEFTIDETKNLILNVSGFESGKMVSTSKLEGTTGMIFVDYSVYKFSTAEDAKSYYDNKINEIKQEGGYTEIRISGCFTYKVDMGFEGESGESFCMKDNVVYSSYVTSSKTYRQIDSFMKDATNLLEGKVKTR